MKRRWYTVKLNDPNNVDRGGVVIQPHRKIAVAERVVNGFGGWESGYFLAVGPAGMGLATNVTIKLNAQHDHWGSLDDPTWMIEQRQQ